MKHQVTFHPAKKGQVGDSSPKFSIVIPTWNSLELLKICVRSIKENSAFNHQIIVHINEGIDGTLEWVKDQQLDFTLAENNCGICYGMNAAASLAETDYIAYLNDDMYVLPDWDKPLAEEIDSLSHHFFFLSATLIEPRETGNGCVIAPEDFGGDESNFREKELLAQYPGFSRSDWSGATWPLNVVHRDVWNLVGGYSTELTPGMGSDPDFSMKLWQLGVRHFRGMGASRVYHFMSKSTGRLSRSKLARNDGRTQFLNKWGMTISTFTKHYLRLGQPWEGSLGEPVSNARLTFDRQRAKIKKLATAWK